MTAPETTCPVCGSAEYEEGYVDGLGPGSSLVGWSPGARSAASFRGFRQKRRGRALVAWRCVGCDRLEFFARGQL